jgi:hypothetical protein
MVATVESAEPPKSWYFDMCHTLWIHLKIGSLNLVCRQPGVKKACGEIHCRCVGLEFVKLVPEPK